jgi:periplasmic protein CpxP/Spy
MMPYLIPRIGGASAATIILSAVLFNLPSAAMAQASPGAMPAAKATSTKKSTPANTSVEARIKSLHDGLQITSAQEPQWQTVADVMRENAKTTGALIEERAANGKTMTAIDDLHSYEAITEAHVAGVKKLIPAVEALYSTMSDAQKKNADAVFSHRTRPSPAKKVG